LRYYEEAIELLKGDHLSRDFADDVRSAYVGKAEILMRSGAREPVLALMREARSLLPDGEDDRELREIEERCNG